MKEAKPDPMIPCPSCAGTGKVLMPEHYRYALELLRDHGPMDAAGFSECARRFYAKPTAWNNRLEYLRALGLVTREKHGRCWMYRVQLDACPTVRRRRT